MFEIPQERQERYEALYNKVENDIKAKNVANTLLKICSVWLDRNGNDNQVNLEFLLGSSLDDKISLKKSFDMHSHEFGFKMNYPNMIGDLY
jgi:hypothetical protein